jgi:hypothetical protein
MGVARSVLAFVPASPRPGRVRGAMLRFSSRNEDALKALEKLEARPRIDEEVSMRVSRLRVGH